jgi:hypothetical protein
MGAVGLPDYICRKGFLNIIKACSDIRLFLYFWDINENAFNLNLCIYGFKIFRHSILCSAYFLKLFYQRNSLGVSALFITDLK